MNQAIQPGMHPDAEMLSAFAEQSLTIAERDEITTHLAVCGRCREVLFLAQEAAGEQQPAAAPRSEAQTRRERHSWFSIWRWAWVPTAAIAGIVGVAVLIHYRQTEVPAQMARNAPEAVSKATAASVRVRETKPESPVEQNKAKEKSARELLQVTGATRDQKQEAKALNEKDALRRDEEAATAGAVSPAPGGVGGVLTGSGQLSGGEGAAIHGALASRPSGQAIGGPMAKQYQQQNIPQQPRQAPMQNAVQRDDLQSYDARKPSFAETAPAPTSQTVAVEGAPQIAPAAPTAKEMTLTPMNTESLDVQAQRTTRLKKAKSITLPSGLGVLSSAASGGRTIALDSSGTLFVSDDGGKEWKPVASQWTGRAVLVRVRPVNARESGFAKVGEPRFNLVTDKLETWVSVDGKTWTAENPVVK